MNNNTAVNGASPQGGEQPQLPVLIQSKEDVTTQQVGTILNVVHVMRALLVTPDEETANRLAGESRIAAQTTLIKACQRLDSIMDEPKRWTVKTSEKLQSVIIAVHEMQKEVLAENLRLVQNAQRPSVTFKPNIVLFNDSYFIAFWGDLDKPGMHIIGRGRTPSEALVDFDNAFHRTPREQFRAIAERTDGPAPEPPAETPEDFHKNNPPPDEEQS